MTAAARTRDAEPLVVGRPALARLDAAWLWLEAFLSRAIAPALQPLLQAGAVANACLVLALVSGVLLLVWYVPSVHQAHASLKALEGGFGLGGIVRSVHRYSSDACMLFVLVHAAKIVLARRFTGARWLAWVTGLAGLGLLWLCGWLGYWLVWDQPAQQVALATAKLLDVLPVFIDPLSRSFLADATVQSLLFFVVFFVHMLLPVALVIALWLHIARLQRARFLPGRTLSLVIVGVTVALSIAVPATAADPARMAVVPGHLTVDAWYLLPLALAERLSGGALWAVVLAAAMALLSVPWWARRGKFRVATVETSRCNSCTLCSQDCPFGAITMVPRTDGKQLPFQAQVDPARCIGCGICSGSCDSVGIGLPWLPVIDERKRYDSWLAESPGARIVLACAHSAGASLRVDAVTGRCAELPDAHVALVPCAGWVHALTLERVLRHGASEAVVVGCGEGNCRYREGGVFAHARVDGERKPALRPDRADRGKVRVLDAGAGEVSKLVRALGQSAAQSAAQRRPRAAALAVGAVLAAALAAIVWLGNAFPYRPAAGAEPELVVTFKHPGALEHAPQARSAEELARLPVHMRGTVVEGRRRAPVHLRVRIDGATVLQGSYAPKGIWGDGNSIAIERLRATPGRHVVEVGIGDTTDAEAFPHVDRRELDFVERERRVVIFERPEGFRWY